MILTMQLKQHLNVHTYDHMSLADTEQQQQVYTSEEDASLFTSDTVIPCDLNIVQDLMETEDHKLIEEKYKNHNGIHSHSKHKKRNTFGEAHIQYHDFNNGDAFTYKDNYTALLQQELQNLYWCLHNPITTKSYYISTEMDIETMLHAM